MTKKMLLYLEAQQGKKVESLVQPGLSAIPSSQAFLFGARVHLSLNMRSNPVLGANIDPEYRSGTPDRVSTRTQRPPPQSIFICEHNADLSED